MCQRREREERGGLTHVCSFYKIQLRMYQRLACKVSIIKLLQESRGENLCDLRSGREFLGTTPRGPKTNKQTKKYTYIYVNETFQKLKTFALGMTRLRE